MILERSDINAIQRKAPNNKLMELVTEFYESDMEVARLKFSAEEYRGAYPCASSVKTAINRCGFHSVKCMVRKNNVYLVKESALEKL